MRVCCDEKAVCSCCCFSFSSSRRSGGLRAGRCAGSHARVRPRLKITVLPILDALPMYVAQDQGLFARNNLQVEFIPAGSAPERDQLIAAGQADGMINEVVSVLFFNKETVRVQMVRYARAATSDSALFSILASQNSQITSAAGLKGAPIGISDGTVIAYLTDRLLAAEGFQPADIQTVSVPKIDARLALLKSGELKAAVLPEPATSAALQQGAKVVLDDTRHPEYSFSTISFRKETLEKNPQAVKSFLLAIEQATELINQDPSKWTQLLVEQQGAAAGAGRHVQGAGVRRGGRPHRAAVRGCHGLGQGEGLPG